ncbi:hypothetical protein TH468_10780 [Thalassospira sp. MCCC 1A03138]|nr:hypothetical protein TH468_10780 [Thalassospira sp. MCCC 1A03138]
MTINTSMIEQGKYPHLRLKDQIGMVTTNIDPKIISIRKVSDMMPSLYRVAAKIKYLSKRGKFRLFMIIQN